MFGKNISTVDLPWSGVHCAKRPSVAQNGHLFPGSKPPKKHVREYAMNETRYTILSRIDPELSAKYIEASDIAAKEKYAYYAKLAAMSFDEA